MRVVYSIGAKLAGGGIGTTAYHGVRGLHRHGRLARVLCGAARPTEIPPSLIRAAGLADRALRKAAVYDESRRLHLLHKLLFDLWASRRIEPAAVFHSWAIHALWSMRRAKQLGLRTVLQRGTTHPRHAERTLREEYERWGLRLRRPRLLLARSDAEVEEADVVLYAAEFAAATYRREGVAQEKLVQVRYGTDVRRFRPGERRASTPFRALFVGEVGLRKGVLYLLEAWRQLGWRDAELIVAGRIDRDVGRLLAPYAGLPGLRFTGHLDDPAPAYREADVFVLPSLNEDGAKATYEALASGLPLIATADAGAVARDGVEGVLVPIRDAGALAAALERLRTDDRGRRAMACAARARAEEFTWDGYGDRLNDALCRIGGA